MPGTQPSTVMTTALPRSLAPDAEEHLVAFVSHKLVPGSADATLGDFPPVRDWVETLRAGRFELLASHLTDPVPLEVVPGADPDAWHAALPPDVPVHGFPEPTLSEAPWESYPAHRVGDGAVGLHLASIAAAPTAAPGVLRNGALEGVLDALSEGSPAVGALRELARSREGRADRLVARRIAEAQATLGQTGGRLPYPTQDLTERSAIEVLLAAEDDDTTTAMLDDMRSAQGDMPWPQEVLVDAHAARRFYQRPEAQTPYLDRPVEGHESPRPEPPEPDVHARIASFGATPALLRVLGLAVGLRVPDPDVLAGLAQADWVAVRFVPATADLTVLAPPRTRVVADGERFAARSSDAWVHGALPLGDDDYVVLDVDPDGAALRTEQHLRDLPRALAAEINGDPASGAPAALRTTGFAIARADRALAARERLRRAEALSTPADVPGAGGPDLLLDDLVRGVRLEVWDDRTGAWHSLHERRVDVTAVVAGRDGGSGGGSGGGRVQVLADAPDTGFLQLGGLSRVPGEDTNPYYLHEVVAGWDGWSLSAPRPGKVVVHDGGRETVVDAPGDEPATGVHVRTRVAPGTLPRLRYGVSYAFRLVAVDLAGGSVPRPTGVVGPREPTPEVHAHLDHLREVYAARDRRLVDAVREAVLADLPAAGRSPLVDLAEGPDTGRGQHGSGGQGRGRQGAGSQGTGSQGTGRAGTGRQGTEGTVTTGVGWSRALPTWLRTGAVDLDEAVAARVAATTAERTAVSEGGAGGLGAVAGAMAAAARASRHLAARAATWRVRPQLDVDPAVLAGLAGVGGGNGGGGGGSGGSGRGDAGGGPRTVTTPRPYLRWDPVPPPTLVARRPLGTGEQLSRLVVRTGIPADHPDAAPTSERHLVPPKATLAEVEAAGGLDHAIGSSDPARHRAAYARALRERGTLLDRWVPDPERPGEVVEQPGIALHERPGADPDTLTTLAVITDHRDTPLGEGQYVVHDVDDLVVPYLPDPHAAGVALVFHDAGAPHTLPEPRVLQALAVPFPQDRPTGGTLRLVLEPAGPDADLDARVDGNVLRVLLPAGRQVRLAASSTLREEDLRFLGLWTSHLASSAGAGGDADDVVAALALRRAATSGWTWWLTPSTDVRLVHAVPAPVRPPQILDLRVLLRPPGLGVAQLAGLVDVHGASTDRLVLRAGWTEQVDDLTAAGPEEVHREDVVADSPVGSWQRWGLLGLIDFLPFGPGESTRAMADGGLGMHRARHTFPDTHHRTVTYRATGLTRYAEMFDPAHVPAPEDPALAGDPVTLSVPSSARPAAPDLVDAVPLLRWEERTEPHHPFAVRRTRRSGVRVWLRRPWFSSGDGELLGVVVSRTGREPDGTISLWGRDPVQIGGETGTATAPPLLGLAHLVTHVAGVASAPEPARPVLPTAEVGLVDLEGTPTVRVLPYRPEYHPGRGQWHVDVALEDGPALWPFVRLAVARYQPDSIPGCALSPVGLTPWVQPLPTRTTTVSRPDADHVRVTVTGVVSLLRHSRSAGGTDEPVDADTPTGDLAELDRRLAESRTVHASLQVLPEGATDLQWETVAERRLPLVGHGAPETMRVTWTGELALPPEDERPFPVELRTPGTQARWRVLVEEREVLDADPVDQPNVRGGTTRTERVVYADVFVL